MFPSRYPFEKDSNFLTKSQVQFIALDGNNLAIIPDSIYFQPRTVKDLLVSTSIWFIRLAGPTMANSRTDETSPSGEKWEDSDEAAIRWMAIARGGFVSCKQADNIFLALLFQHFIQDFFIITTIITYFIKHKPKFIPICISSVMICTSKRFLHNLTIFFFSIFGKKRLVL